MISQSPCRAGPKCAAPKFPKATGLEVLMESDEAGLCLVADAAHRSLYMFNHIEYDTAFAERRILA